MSGRRCVRSGLGRLSIFLISIFLKRCLKLAEIKAVKLALVIAFTFCYHLFIHGRLEVLSTTACLKRQDLKLI